MAVSWGGGGAGILLLAVPLSVFVFEFSPFASPLVFMPSIGGGNGGGRGGSGHAV